jgi:hypothetical protein
MLAARITLTQAASTRGAKRKEAKQEWSRTSAGWGGRRGPGPKSKSLMLSHFRNRTSELVSDYYQGQQAISGRTSAVGAGQAQRPKSGSQFTARATADLSTVSPFDTAGLRLTTASRSRRSRGERHVRTGGTGHAGAEPVGRF